MRRFGAALAAMALLAGCGAFSKTGDLEVPSPDVAVCAPAGHDRDVLFGVLVRNMGDKAVTVRDIAVGSSANVAASTVRLDVTGPDWLGTDFDPADSAAGQARVDRALARLVDPRSAEIGPGAYANIIVMMTPADATIPAVVDSVRIDYVQGGRHHNATSRMALTLAPGETC